jgi:uncharacterized protein YcbX
MTVRELSIASVKGTRLVHPASLRVGPDGVADDRRFHVVAADGRQHGATRSALTRVGCDWDPDGGRLALSLPGGEEVAGEVAFGGPVTGHVTWDGGRPVEGREVLGPWSHALSQYLGEPVRLVEATGAGRAVDVAPVTLVSDASVRRLEAELGANGIGSRRFRMTLTLAGLRAHEEDEWYGRELRAGSCVLRVAGPVPRCAVTTRDPLTGVRDQPTLKAIVAYRPPVALADGTLVKAPFGVYAEVVQPGTVAAGDRVELLG